MKKLKFTVFTLLGLAAFAAFGTFMVSSQAQIQPPLKLGASFAATATPTPESRKKRLTQTKESQSAMKPAEALRLLKEGNRRFYEGQMTNRDLRAQIGETAEAQYPFATILSCQDSRTSNELLFDLNKGDAFSLRIAGNVVNEDILGGMEFGSKAAGARLIAVIGHTKCGAIYGACDNVKLGNLTGLLDKIRPAVSLVPASVTPRNSKNPAFVKAVTEQNVRYQMRQIKEKSPILKEMIDKGEVGLVGGIYDLSTGKVEFFEN